MPESVGDLLPILRPYAGDSGTCSDAKVIEYINLARSLLWNKTQTNGTCEWACIKCVQFCWTIPSRFKQILLAWIGNCPVSLGNEWYQSVPQIGMVNDRNFCQRKLIEVGGQHVTFQEYEVGPYLWALQAESNQDVGKEITVFSIDRYDTRQKGTVALGLAPQLATGPTMTKAVLAVTKPETVGRVRLYAVDPNRNDQRLLLAVYQPQDINPSFRRFKVLGNKCQEPITIYAKKKFHPVKDANDLIEFTEEAMIHAITAVVYRENRDMDQFMTNLSLAVAEVNREIADDEQPVGSPLRMFFPDNVYSLTPIIPIYGTGNSGYPFGS